jgi:hypothetical protein
MTVYLSLGISFEKRGDECVVWSMVKILNPLRNSVFAVKIALFLRILKNSFDFLNCNFRVRTKGAASRKKYLTNL